MRTPVVILIGALGLFACAAASAANSSAPAGGSAAPAAVPAAPAAAPAAPAGASFSSGARGASGGGGGRASFSGPHAGGAGWTGPRGGVGTISRGSFGTVSRDNFGGAIRAGAAGTPLAIAHAGRASGFDFIVPAHHGGAEVRGAAMSGMATRGGKRDIRNTLAWAPATASAAHAMRLVEGLHTHTGREVRPLKTVSHKAQPNEPPLPQHRCLGGGPDWSCLLPGAYGQTSPWDAQWTCLYSRAGLCSPFLFMPQSVCGEPDSTGQYRYFYCARPVKMGLRN